MINATDHYCDKCGIRAQSLRTGPDGHKHEGCGGTFVWDGTKRHPEQRPDYYLAKIMGDNCLVELSHLDSTDEKATVDYLEKIHGRLRPLTKAEASDILEFTGGLFYRPQFLCKKCHEIKVDVPDSFCPECKHDDIRNAKRITLGDFTYHIDEDGKIEGALACCFSSDHFSHPYCYDPPKGFIEAEKEGLISRSFTGAGTGMSINDLFPEPTSVGDENFVFCFKCRKLHTKYQRFCITYSASTPNKDTKVEIIEPEKELSAWLKEKYVNESMQ